MKLTTPIIVIVFTALICWVTWRVFGYDIPSVPNGTALAYGSFLTAIAGGIFGLWKLFKGWNK